MNHRLYSTESPALQDVPGRQNVDVRRWSEQPVARPRLPPRPSPNPGKDNLISLPERGRRSEETTAKGASSLGGNGVSVEHCWEWEKSWETRRASEARAEMEEVTFVWQNSQEKSQGALDSSHNISLTLIRRYDGEQWNVAKMRSIERVPKADAMSDADADSGFIVDILNPGYSVFANVETPHKIDDVEKAILRRRLQLSKKVKTQSTGHIPGIENLRVSGEDSGSSFDSRQTGSDSFTAPRDHLSVNKSMASRGCSLESPWNGLCEFSTSVAGRSLKCKHLYSSSNPKFGPGTISAPVSELRFNLPSSKAFGTPNAKSLVPGTPREGKRSSMFPRSHHRQSSSYFERDAISSYEGFGAKVELEDRLDLSLGQEHAGGGFGGKQAKLGKLIIETEGLQMLDLIVAANMALWWKVYERTT